MVNFLAVACKVISVIILVICAVCVWKTGEYFNLQREEKVKTLLAWDLLLLIVLMLLIIIGLIR